LQLFQIGWPISIQLGGELSALTAAAYLLGLFGTSALAAAQVTGQYLTLFIMISVGLASGTSILISQAYGANNKQEIKHIAHAGMILIAIISSCFVVTFISIPQTLIDWYLDIHHPSHSQLVNYAIKFMAVAAIYVSFDGIRNILTSILRGLQDTKKTDANNRELPMANSNTLCLHSWLYLAWRPSNAKTSLSIWHHQCYAFYLLPISRYRLQTSKDINNGSQTLSNRLNLSRQDLEIFRFRIKSSCFVDIESSLLAITQFKVAISQVIK
jgi:TRAP-type mannitol/chloroaromatic compound transport system permease small subunit